MSKKPLKNIDSVRKIQKVFENNIFLHEVSINHVGAYAKEYDTKALVEIVDLLNKKIKKTTSKIEFTGKEIKIVFDSMKKHPLQSDLFSRNTLVSMITTMDMLFIKLFELYYKKFPEKLSIENQSISYKELKKIEKIEDAQNFLISREIESILVKQGLSERLKILNSEIKIETDKIILQIDKVKQLVKIRNLIVHNDGRADDDYVKKYGNSIIKKDEKIKIDNEFLINSLYLIYFFGTYILQEAQLQISESIQTNDFLLNNLLHTLVKNNQFEYIKPIYNFSQNKKLDEANKKLIVINYCIGLKKQGKDEKHILKVLEKEDWSLEKNEFKMCKFALLGKDKDFYSEFEKLIEQKEISAGDIEHWVIFDFYRDRKKFKSLAKKAKPLEIT